MSPPGQVTAPPTFVRLAAHPLRWRLLAELADSDYRVRELVARVDQPQNLVSDSYYHLDLDRCADELTASGAALHPALHRAAAPPIPPAPQPRPGRLAVLFVCTGNSARSAIAEALLRHHTAGAVAATSAGTRPKPSLHPHTIRVLRERFGIDIADQRPRHIDDLAGRAFDHVITLCDKAREACPEFPDHPRRAHWSVPDPAVAEGTDDAGYPAFERTAADIDTRIGHLLPVLAVHRKEEPP
jgi:protein-tyrosine-phosphatase